MRFMICQLIVILIVCPQYLTPQIRNTYKERQHITTGSALQSTVSKSQQGSSRHICPHLSKLEKLLWWELRYFMIRQSGELRVLFVSLLVISDSFDKQIRSTNKVCSQPSQPAATPRNLFRFPVSFYMRLHLVFLVRSILHFQHCSKLEDQVQHFKPTQCSEATWCSLHYWFLTNMIIMH